MQHYGVYFICNVIYVNGKKLLTNIEMPYLIWTKMFLCIVCSWKLLLSFDIGHWMEIAAD